METNITIGADSDSLFRRIKNNINGAANSGEALNDLLEMFHGGYPTAKVLELLGSSNASTIRAAAWLMSELGTAACVHSDSVWFLLESEDPKVRFSIINCVVVCAGDADGEVIAKLISHLLDSNATIRWKALDAVVRLSDLQINAALNWLGRNRACCSYMAEIRLLSLERSLAIERVIESIEAGRNVSEMAGKLIAVSAIRAKLPLDRVRKLADKLDDDDLHDFLADLD